LRFETSVPFFFWQLLFLNKQFVKRDWLKHGCTLLAWFGQRCFFCHDARKPSGSIGTYTVFLWFEQSLDLNKFLAGHDTVLASFGSAGLSDLARYCQVLDQKQISSANLLKTVEAISTWP
jgi:hypothetical protein